ncbi:MAG TPA: hypothetical protein VIH05_09980 [Tepidiformaceae bacterium]
MPHRDGTLKAREFLFYTEDLALAGLPAEFPRPERRVMWTILQMHYGDPNVHFELQPHVGRGLVELGLHFEGPVELNDAWAALIASRAAEVMAGLGPEWELEEWTASWRRLHRTWRFERLTPALGREVGESLCSALRVLQPLVMEGQQFLPVAEQRQAAGTGTGGRWRSKARR